MSKIIKPTQEEIVKYNQNSQENTGVLSGLGEPIVKITEADNISYNKATRNGFDFVCFAPEDNSVEETKQSLAGSVINNPTFRKYAAIVAGVAMATIPSMVNAEDIQDAESPNYFSDQPIDFLAKSNLFTSKDYNAFNVSAKLSRNPLGANLSFSNGIQELDSGDKVRFNDLNVSFGGYHVFEPDWGKINAGLRLGFDNIKFEDYGLENANSIDLGAYAKFTTDDLKAFISHNQSIAGEFKLNGVDKEPEYRQSNTTLGFKIMGDNAYGGLDLDIIKAVYGMEDDSVKLGESTKNIWSLYGGVYNVGGIEEMKAGIYGGYEDSFGKREVIKPGVEFELTNIIDNHWGLRLGAGYQKEMGLYGKAGLVYRFKENK